MIRHCRKVAESEVFQSLILALIVLNALVMGLETSRGMQRYYGEWFDLVLDLSQLVFVAEMTIRLLAFAPRFWEFFRDFWNTYDFVIVAASLVPVVGPFSLVARLLRVLRVARIFSVSDELRVFLTASRSTLGVAWRTAVVMVVLGYIFGVSGFYLFEDIDPGNWGRPERACVSIFCLALFQDVRGFVEPAVDRSLYLIIYFVAFYLTLGLLALNVLAAVVACSVKSELERRSGHD